MCIVKPQRDGQPLCVRDRVVRPWIAALWSSEDPLLQLNRSPLLVSRLATRLFKLVCQYEDSRWTSLQDISHREACLTLQLIPIAFHQSVKNTSRPLEDKASPPTEHHSFLHISPTSSHIKATHSPLTTSCSPPNQQHTATRPRFQPPATDPRCRSAKARSATSHYPQTILRSMAQERESPTCLFSSLYAFAKHGWAGWEAPFCPK